MDVYAIANALAARYTATYMTAPAGLKAITDATAQAPNNIPNTPYLIVWPSEGSLTYLSGIREGEAIYHVIFYYSAKSEGDMPRETTALQKWVSVLIDQTHGQTKLGLSIVRKALPEKWEIGTVTYAGEVFEAATLHVHVWTEETVILVP